MIPYRNHKVIGDHYERLALNKENFFTFWSPDIAHQYVNVTANRSGYLTSMMNYFMKTFDVVILFSDKNKWEAYMHSHSLIRRKASMRIKNFNSYTPNVS